MAMMDLDGDEAEPDPLLCVPPTVSASDELRARTVASRRTIAAARMCRKAIKNAKEKVAHSNSTGDACETGQGSSSTKVDDLWLALVLVDFFLGGWGG